MIRSLSKCTVNIKDTSFLGFLYPDYKFINSFDDYISADRVVFTGLLSEKNEKLLTSIFDDYIIVSEYGSVRLLSVLDFISFYHPSQVSLAKYYESLSYEDFMMELKQSIILDKPLRKLSESGVSVYSLYESMTQSSASFYSTLFKLLHEYDASVVLSSLLTFLFRVKKGDWDSLSQSYRALLNKAKIKFGDRIDSTILSVSSIESESSLVSILNLYWGLNG